jgi:hypothetical protein
MQRMCPVGHGARAAYVSGWTRISEPGGTLLFQDYVLDAHGGFGASSRARLRIWGRGGRLGVTAH